MLCSTCTNSNSFVFGSTTTIKNVVTFEEDSLSGCSRRLVFRQWLSELGNSETPFGDGTEGEPLPINKTAVRLQVSLMRRNGFLNHNDMLLYVVCKWYVQFVFESMRLFLMAPSSFGSHNRHCISSTMQWDTRSSHVLSKRIIRLRLPPLLASVREGDFSEKK